MRKSLAIAALAVLLGGCAVQRIDSRLGSLIGGSLQTAISQLGEPSDRLPDQGGVFYRWKYRSNGVVRVPMEITTSSALAGSKVRGGSLITEELIPVRYECSIELAVDPSNRVRQFRWTGDVEPCIAQLRNAQ